MGRVGVDVWVGTPAGGVNLLGGGGNYLIQRRVERWLERRRREEMNFFCEKTKKVCEFGA